MASEEESVPLIFPTYTPPTLPPVVDRAWYLTKAVFVKPEYLEPTTISREASLSFYMPKDDPCDEKHPVPQQNEGEKLSFIGLVAVCYFLVCGGAYGTEDLASSIPPLFALLGVLCLPWVWSMPVALIVAELGSSMPSNNGFLGWIGRAWGPGASFFDGWIMVITIIIDQSIYPVIFVSYLSNIYDFEDWQAFLISLCYILLALVLNLAGISSVGGVSTFLSFVTLLPFAIYVGTGFASSEFDVTRWTQTTMDNDKEWDVALYLSVLVWCTCAYEYAGFLCGDVRNPKKTFPLAMFTVVFMMIATYLLPLSITVATKHDLTDVTDGAYPDLAANLGSGNWLAYLMILGGLASTMGTYITYLHTSATALYSLSENGMAPKIFSSLPQLKAPVVGMIFFTMTTAVLVNFEFSILIQIESFLYCIHAILLCSCLPRLRIKEPDMERPFALPFGPVGAILVPILPMLIGLASIASIFYASYLEAVISIGLLIIGGVVYICAKVKPWRLLLCGYCRDS